MDGAFVFSEETATSKVRVLFAYTATSVTWDVLLPPASLMYGNLEAATFLSVTWFHHLCMLRPKMKILFCSDSFSLQMIFVLITVLFVCVCVA